MNVYAGLDVSSRETSVCVVDAEGKVLLERKVPSEPDTIAPVLQAYATDLRQVGVEASSWVAGCKRNCRRAGSRPS